MKNSYISHHNQANEVPYSEALKNIVSMSAVETNVSFPVEEELTQVNVDQALTRQVVNMQLQKDLFLQASPAAIGYGAILTK